MKNQYEIRGDKVIIFVREHNRIREAEISIEHLERAKEFPNSWFAQHSRNTYYVCGVITIDGKKRHVRLHRWLLNPPDDLVIDHIDGNALRNTIDNMRICTPKENGQNVRIPHHLPRGVKHHGSRFRAVMTLDKIKYDLGVYDTVDEADEIVRYYRSKYMPYSTEALNQQTYSREELVAEIKEMRAKKRKPTSSQYVGVYRMPDGRWGAQWSYTDENGHATKYIGGYPHEVTAAIAHDIVVFKHFGVDGVHKLNFPDIFNSSTVTWSTVDNFTSHTVDAHVV